MYKRQEPADEVAEETAEDAADEQKMATDENISNASYVGRTVEITPDSKKAEMCIRDRLYSCGGKGKQAYHERQAAWWLHGLSYQSAWYII